MRFDFSFLRRNSCLTVPFSYRAVEADLNTLLGFSTIESLCRFQNTTSTARVRVSAEVLERITNLLTPYFAEPLMFLQQLSPLRLNAVLSGHFVSAMLDSTNSQQYTYLDVFSGRDSFSDMLSYLLKKEGATVKGVLADVPGLGSKAFKCALQLETASGGLIRLIQSVRSSPFFPITLYYSTHLMNAITDNVLVVAYPKLTFLHRGVLTEDEYPADPEPTSFSVADLTERDLATDNGLPAGRVASASAAFANLDKWRSFADRDCVHIRLNDAAFDVGPLKMVTWNVCA